MINKSPNQIIEADTFKGRFDLYKSKEFRRQQNKERPFREKANNWLLKFSPIDWWRRNRATVTARDMVPVLEKIQFADSLIDLGCGQLEIADEVVKFLQDKFPDILAIGIDHKTDVSYRILRKPNIAFCRGDVTQTGLPDDSVDVVLACYILQALDGAGREKLFEEIRRIRAPGGTVIFLEVIERKVEAEDKKNKTKHVILNANAPYFVLSDEEWVEYIGMHGYRVDASTFVIGRCKAYMAHPI